MPFLQRLQLSSDITGHWNRLISTSRLWEFCTLPRFLISLFFLRLISTPFWITCPTRASIPTRNSTLVLILVQNRWSHFLLVCLNSFSVFWQHWTQTTEFNFMFNVVLHLDGRFCIRKMLTKFWVVWFESLSEFLSVNCAIFVALQPVFKLIVKRSLSKVLSF